VNQEIQENKFRFNNIAVPENEREKRLLENIDSDYYPKVLNSADY